MPLQRQRWLQVLLVHSPSLARRQQLVLASLEPPRARAACSLVVLALPWVEFLAVSWARRQQPAGLSLGRPQALLSVKPQQSLVDSVEDLVLLLQVTVDLV